MSDYPSRFDHLCGDEDEIDLEIQEQRLAYELEHADDWKYE